MSPCVTPTCGQVTKEESVEALSLFALEGEWITEFTFVAVDMGVAVEVAPPSTVTAGAGGGGDGAP